MRWLLLLLAFIAGHDAGVEEAVETAETETGGDDTELLRALGTLAWLDLFS